MATAGVTGSRWAGLRSGSQTLLHPQGLHQDGRRPGQLRQQRGEADGVRRSEQQTSVTTPPLVSSFGWKHQPNPGLLLPPLPLSLPPTSLFSRVMNTGSQFVMEGVKNLVLKQHVSVAHACARRST